MPHPKELEGHGHHHRSRDYEWKEEEADEFLRMARKGARRRYRPIAETVAGHLPGKGEGAVVLDLGCGPALLLPELARLAPRARLVGLDPSRPMLQLAHRVLSGADALPGTYELLEGAAESIPLDDGSVDVVVSLKNLHEWSDAEEGVSEVARVLASGGVLVLADSNGAYPLWKLRALVAFVRLTEGRRATGKYLGPYKDAYTPDQVEVLLSGAGLEVVSSDTRGVEFLYVARRP